MPISMYASTGFPLLIEPNPRRAVQVLNLCVQDQPGAATSALVKKEYRNDTSLIDGRTLFAPEISLVNIENIWPAGKKKQSIPRCYRHRKRKSRCLWILRLVCDFSNSRIARKLVIKSRLSCRSRRRRQCRRRDNDSQQHDSVNRTVQTYDSLQVSKAVKNAIKTRKERKMN